MTNLFLNDSRYFTMDNEPNITSSLSKSDNSPALAKMKPVFFRHLETAVDDCCMRIDIEYGLQLGKVRETIGKEQYIRLLEYLRSIRNDIKKDYLLKVNQYFEDGNTQTSTNTSEHVDFSKISLSSDNCVKENNEISRIIRQCEHSCYEEITKLNKQLILKQGKQVIALNENPMFPEKLVQALVAVAKSLKLNSDYRIALYKTFEQNVFNQLGFIYVELIKQVETFQPSPSYVVSEIKEQIESTPANDDIEQTDESFSKLQQKLDQWRLARFPSTYDVIPLDENGCYEHFEIQNALQILSQFHDDLSDDEKKQPLKWQVLKKLQEFTLNGSNKNLSKQDQDVLDLISLIFRTIAKNQTIAVSVKTEILKLEMPLASVSLDRFSIFTNPHNPARSLLDNLLEAAMFLDSNDDESRLLQDRILNTAHKLTQNDGFEFNAWVTEAKEFSSYINNIEQRQQAIEQNAIHFMDNQQSSDTNRKMIEAAVENSMVNKTLPTAIIEFLRKPWSEVLLQAHVRKNEQPELWETSVRTMNELIISVVPPADDKQRQGILKLLPSLVNELRSGLKRIDYDKQAQSRFFKELAVWHIILMDKTGKAASEAAKHSTETVLPAQATEQTISDSYSVLADSLIPNNWALFDCETGRRWGKLIWKNGRNMLFIGKNGEKIAEIDTVALADRLRNKQAAIVKTDNKTITDKVLLTLMNL